MFGDGQTVMAKLSQGTDTVGEYADKLKQFFAELAKLYPFIRVPYDEENKIENKDAILRMIYRGIDNEAEWLPSALLQDTGVRVAINPKDYQPQVFMSVRIGSTIPGLGNFCTIYFEEDESFCDKYFSYKTLTSCFNMLIDIWRPISISVGRTSLSLAVEEAIGISDVNTGWMTYVTPEVSDVCDAKPEDFPVPVFRATSFGQSGLFVQATEKRIVPHENEEYDPETIQYIYELNQFLFRKK